jgi:hypothetical protein
MVVTAFYNKARTDCITGDEGKNFDVFTHFMREEVLGR